MESPPGGVGTSNSTENDNDGNAASPIRLSGIKLKSYFIKKGFFSVVIFIPTV